MTKTVKDRVKFNNANAHFSTELKKRVADYFEDNNLSIKANRAMYVKSLSLMLLTAAFYTLLLTKADRFAFAFPLYCILGFLLTMMGFNIAHDAAHNAYSSNPKVNRALSYFFDFAGLSSYIWKHTHNNLHHTYTNISNVDEDITNFPFFRYTHQEKFCRYHNYQHLYAPILYCLVGLFRLFFLDSQFFYNQVKNSRKAIKPMLLCAFFKGIHFSFLIGIPLLFVPIPWWQIFACYLGAICISSITLAIVVSLAHVNDQVVMLDSIGEAGLIDTHWAVHEMQTTCNFGTENRVLSTLVGGLNFQIEHHLFPQICHIHYPKIAPIIQKTAIEFGVPYHTIPTFLGAIKSHFKLLKNHSKERAPLQILGRAQK